MHRHEITPRQLGFWIAAAVSAPLSAAAGAGWAAMLLAALAMLPLGKLSAGGWESMGRVLCLAQAAWMSILAGLLLRHSGVFWPGDRSEWVVPLVLTALAATTKAEAAPRAGAVVALCMVALYVPVVIAGGMQVKQEWLTAHPGKWNGTLLTGLLIPCLWPLWRESGKGQGHTLGAVAAIGLLFGVLCQGILSPKVGERMPDAFYQVGRTMELGVLSRMEPVVSVAATLGWYVAAAFLHASARRMTKQAGCCGKGTVISLGVITALSVVSDVRVPGIVSVAVCLVLWVAMPLWTEKRNFRKTEKRC